MRTTEPDPDLPWFIRQLRDDHIAPTADPAIIRAPHTAAISQSASDEGYDNRAGHRFSETPVATAASQRGLSGVHKLPWRHPFQAVLTALALLAAFACGWLVHPSVPDSPSPVPKSILLAAINPSDSPLALGSLRKPPRTERDIVARLETPHSKTDAQATMLQPERHNTNRAPRAAGTKPPVQTAKIRRQPPVSGLEGSARSDTEALSSEKQVASTVAIEPVVPLLQQSIREPLDLLAGTLPAVERPIRNRRKLPRCYGYQLYRPNTVCTMHGTS